jgi:hypothetical protein
MRIPFVHHFHSKASPVQNIGPSLDDTALIILNGLSKVETVKIERHCAYAQGSEPDSNHRPGGQEEVE